MGTLGTMVHSASSAAFKKQQAAAKTGIPMYCNSTLQACIYIHWDGSDVLHTMAEKHYSMRHVTYAPKCAGHTCGAEGTRASRSRCNAWLRAQGPCVSSGSAAATNRAGSTPPGKLRAAAPPSMLLVLLPETPVKLLAGVTNWVCCSSRQPSAAAAASCRAMPAAASLSGSGTAAVSLTPPAPPADTAAKNGLGPPAASAGPPAAAPYAAPAAPSPDSSTGELL